MSRGAAKRRICCWSHAASILGSTPSILCGLNARRLIGGIFALAVIGQSIAAVACPFCGVVGRSLAQRRDAADVTAVGESAGPAARDDVGRLVQPFAVGQTFRGRATTGDIVAARVAGPIAGTAILFGAADGWEAVAADEPLLAHVAAAPAITEQAAGRLAWYAARLEHPDPAIAADAFTEFGLAAFADVRAAATIPSASP